MPTKADDAPAKPKADAGAVKMAKRIDDLQAQIDRLNVTVGELVAGNQHNAIEAWS